PFQGGNTGSNPVGDITLLPPALSSLDVLSPTSPSLEHRMKLSDACSRRPRSPQAARRSAGLLSASLLLFVPLLAPGTSFAESCVPASSVRLDTTQDVRDEPIYLGKAVGQTFFAPETVITAITAWRYFGESSNYSIWNIHVLPVDSLGIPDVHHILRR